VGLWITKQVRNLAKIIWLGWVRGLDEIVGGANGDGTIYRSKAVGEPPPVPAIACLPPSRMPSTPWRRAGRSAATLR
jgi:hypothetical protein